MSSDYTTKIYDLTIQRQVQDRIIAQLRAECSELKMLLQQRNSTMETTERTLIQLSQYQRRLSKIERKRDQFNTTKEDLVKVIMAMLENLRLECRSLKVQLVDQIGQMRQDFVTLLSDLMQSHHQNVLADESYQSRVEQQTQRIAEIYETQLLNFQNRIAKLTQQLQDSELNEINLISLNKKQLQQIEDLKNRLKRTLSEDEKTPSQSAFFSRTTNDWNKNNPDYSSRRLENQFASTQPQGWGGYRSFSHISVDNPDIQQLKRSNDNLDKQFSAMKLQEQRNDNYASNSPYVSRQSGHFKKAR